MRRMFALVLVVTLLCGILQTGGYATPNDPSESDSTVVIKDVLLREEFTFTDHNGNVSEPQVLCRREYDVRGRLTRIIDDTGLVRGWDENDELTFYHTRSFGDIFQPPINYLKTANELMSTEQVGIFHSPRHGGRADWRTSKGAAKGQTVPCGDSAPKLTWQ